MAVRIRVYPNNGLGGAYGAYGPAGMYGQLARTQLSNERKTSNLRLQYERALWQEKLKNVQLATAMQYSGGRIPVGAYGAHALYGNAMLAGGIPGGFGMLPGLLGASGQVNVTNQSGAGNQSVSNSNHYSNHVVWNQTPGYGYGGFPFGGWGGGGFLSSLLGALI